MEKLGQLSSPYSKLFYVVNQLSRNEEISDREKVFLKDLIILENEEILQALLTFEQDQDFSKLKRSFNNLLRFVKAEANSPMSSSISRSEGKARPTQLKIPYHKQFSFLSQIPSPSRRPSIENSPLYFRSLTQIGIKEGHASPPIGTLEFLQTFKVEVDE